MKQINLPFLCLSTLNSYLNSNLCSSFVSTTIEDILDGLPILGQSKRTHPDGIPLGRAIVGFRGYSEKTGHSGFLKPEHPVSTYSAACCCKWACTALFDVNTFHRKPEKTGFFSCPKRGHNPLSNLGRKKKSSDLDISARQRMITFVDSPHGIGKKKTITRKLKRSESMNSRGTRRSSQSSRGR